MLKRFVLIVLLFPTMVLWARRDDQPVTEQPMSDWGTVYFEDLKREPLWGTMHDIESMAILDPNKFDITLEVENDFLYEKPELHIDGNKIILEIHPRGDWCECLFPTNLNIKIVSTQKPGAYDEEGKTYAKTIHPVHITVVKNRSWFPRCIWVIISIIGLILFCFYLRAMLRKRRFKKMATVTPVICDRWGNEKDDAAGQCLRKEGFPAWFARWFLPGDEKNSLDFMNPPVNGISFIASESPEVVLLPKSAVDPQTMEVRDYDPNDDAHPEKPIKLSDNDTITILNLNGVKQGYLRFNPNNERDGGGYRVFLSLLLTASILTILFMIYLMIKSFI